MYENPPRATPVRIAQISQFARPRFARASRTAAGRKKRKGTGRLFLSRYPHVAGAKFEEDGITLRSRKRKGPSELRKRKLSRMANMMPRPAALKRRWAAGGWARCFSAKYAYGRRARG